MAPSGIDAGRELGMHFVQDGHHQTCNLFSCMIIVVNALRQSDALLVSVIDPGQASLDPVAGIVHRGVNFSERCHLFLSIKQVAPLGPLLLVQRA